MTSSMQSSDALEIIEFYVDELLEDGSSYRSFYGMNVAKVLEIIRLPTITEMPGKHHQAALGTFNLRDKVLPLVDLCRWLDKKSVNSSNDKVIVTEFSSVVTAFIVSGVTRIHRITWANVEPPGKHLRTFSHDSITGVVRFEERIVFLLDMEHIISTMDPSINLANRAEGITETGGTGYHVLIADDSTSIRNIIASTMKKANFAVSTATCGREAWEQLKEWERLATEQKVPITNFVNLVISDIEMPEMDGHTLTRMIKAENVFDPIPVVLFSSLISQVVFDKGVKAGADDQVSKPDLPELTDRVTKLIKQKAELYNA